MRDGGSLMLELIDLALAVVRLLAELAGAA